MNYSQMKEILSNLSDATTNLNCIDQLNSNYDLNEATSNYSLQALNILAEVINLYHFIRAYRYIFFIDTCGKYRYEHRYN